MFYNKDLLKKKGIHLQNYFPMDGLIHLDIYIHKILNIVILVQDLIQGEILSL